jgi:murein DD-endopeptidase MepM/ murein hydrolase activator NlpD
MNSFLWILFFTFFLRPIFSNPECWENKVCTEYSISSNRSEVKFTLKPKAFKLQYSVFVIFQLSNLEIENSPQTQFVLNQSNPEFKYTLIPIDPTKSHSFAYKFSIQLGNFNAIHHDESYELPFPTGSYFWVDQGYDGQFSHFGDIHNSLDWSMPKNTPILASRGGIVIYVKDGFPDGKNDVSYKDKANTVSILHDDGTIGEYAHLNKGSIFVKELDLVKKGDKIALSGNSGYTTNPHLHMHVYKPLGPNLIETIPVNYRHFYNPNGEILKEGRIYFSVDEKDLPKVETGVFLNQVRLCQSIEKNSCIPKDNDFKKNQKVFLYIPLTIRDKFDFDIKFKKMNYGDFKVEYSITTNSNSKAYFSYIDLKGIDPNLSIGRWEVEIYKNSNLIKTISFDVVE